MDRPARSKYSLLVFGDNTCQTFDLPEHGDIILGRARECSVQIDDPSVSRKHAVLRIGTTLSIKDLGSANGTRVRDPQGPLVGDSTAKFRHVALRPGDEVNLEPGHVLHLGSVVAVIQRTQLAARPRRLWPHGYFEGCVEEECARSARSGAAFSVVRVRVESVVPEGSVEEILAECTRSTDQLGSYGPGQLEVLLVDADQERVEEIIHRINSSLNARFIVAKMGIAHYPKDGRTPEALMAKAGMTLHGSANGMGSGPQKTSALVVVEDPVMQRLYRLAERVADSTINVLILGETGVGKEVFAEAIHKMSPRSAKPFLRLNCAALSETLLESELFGHEKGAFTGAISAKQGLLETAQGGTVFLDEIGELPPAIQVKLLRVLEERQVTRVGGLRSKPLDVRFVFATNRDLEVEVRCRAFREDLYFRINGISMVLPPLRERRREIAPLTCAFLVDFSRRAGRRPPALTPEVLDLLEGYSWPGNIRELRNVVERALVLCDGVSILPEHLPLEKMSTTTVSAPRTPPPPPGAIPTIPPIRPRIPTGLDDLPNMMEELDEQTPSAEKTQRISREDMDNEVFIESPTDAQSAKPRVPPFETIRPAAGQPAVPDESYPLRRGPVTRDEITRALEKCAGNQTQAAKMLGISRRTLVTRIEEYGLPRPRKQV